MFDPTASIIFVNLNTLSPFSFSRVCGFLPRRPRPRGCECSVLSFALPPARSRASTEYRLPSLRREYFVRMLNLFLAVEKVNSLVLFSICFLSLITFTSVTSSSFSRCSSSSFCRLSCSISESELAPLSAPSV